jgi:hypothetical protein
VIAPAGLATGLVVAAAGVAHAEALQAPVRPAAPDPAVVEASDANLESTANRRGLTFAATLGGGLMIGLGIKDSVGRGGSLSLRLGHVATPRTLITFELGITAALHRPSVTAGQMTSGIKPNTDANLLAGAQYYVNPSLWLRGAGGVGVYQGRDVAVSSVAVGDVTLVGPALLAGAGLELARFKWAVLGIEVATSAMISGDGVLITGGVGLGLSFD